MTDSNAATDAAPVLISRQDAVMVITINRPAARNAVNLGVSTAIGQALEQAQADNDIRAVVLTGAGDKAFCAGADLVALARGEKIRADDPVSSAWGFAGFVTHHIDKPVIAAVNGLAFGGGTELVLAADLAVAAEHASFGLPEAKVGVYAGAGGAFRIVEQLPMKIGMEMLLTGEPITAQRAYELGLVNKVVAADALMEAAMDLARRIVGNAPLSIRASKRIAKGMDADGRFPLEEVKWDRSRREGAAVIASEDAREGPRAFAERRKPEWKGR